MPEGAEYFKETDKEGENDLDALFGALGFEIAALKANMIAISNQVVQLNKRVSNIYLLLEKVPK